jgi:hypothetical protein
MFRRALLCAVLVTSVTAAPALASPGHNHNHRHRTMTSWSDQRGDRGDSDDSSDDDSDDAGSDDSTDATTPDTGTAGPAGGVVASGTQSSIQVETTSYSYGDNQGSNNATICCGKLHKTAAGSGTYADPITLAVPGSGGSGMQTPAGTRVYFTKYRFYGIVEDSGATPKSLRRFDIWSDGRGLSTSAESDCMDRLTGTSSAILNPPAGEPVGHVGPLADASGCHVAGG